MTAPGGVGGRNHFGGTPADHLTREVGPLLRDALHAGASPVTLLAAVANGLTGETNGYRERLLTAALNAAWEQYGPLTQAEAKTLEDQRRQEARP